MRKKAIILLICCSILLITGCGNSAPAAAEINASTASSTEPEIIIQEKEVIKEVPIYVTDTTASNPVITTESVYSNGGFQAECKAALEGREPVWMGKKRQFSSEGTAWGTSDPSIAIVDQDGWVSAVSEGLATIYATTEDGSVVNSYDIYCTTYNDGQDPRNYSPLSDSGKMITLSSDYPTEALATKVNTVRDLINLLKHKWIYYNPETPICATGGDTNYTWALDGSAVLDLKYGVCCDIANVASYCLQYDYEELGFIYHYGKGIGHVYNYVYEDGYYYVFDLTEVISDQSNRSYMDFNIYQLESLSDFVPEILDWKTEPSRLLSVVAVNSMNQQEQAANYMSYMTDDSKCLDGSAVVGFEEGIEFEVLYMNPDYESQVISIPHDEIPANAPSYFRDDTIFEY